MKHRGKIIVGGVAVAAALWLFSERILFSMNWTSMGADGAEIIEDLRGDMAARRTGPRETGVPCMKARVELDLSLHISGYLPRSDDIVMRVDLTGAQVMVDRLYLGPVVSEVRVDRVPLCLDDPGPVSAEDEAAFAYLAIVFYDLAGNRYQSFGSEDAVPVLAWQDVAVELLEVPRESSSQGVTRIRVTPIGTGG